MTAYFDQLASKIQEAPEDSIALVDLEEQVFHDILCCVSSPGFPEDLRTRILQALLQYGCSQIPDGYLPAIEEPKRALHQMCQELHGIFHEVIRDPSPYTDDPLHYQWILRQKGQDHLEDLVGSILTRSR